MINRTRDTDHARALRSRQEKGLGPLEPITRGALSGTSRWDWDNPANRSSWRPGDDESAEAREGRAARSRGGEKFADFINTLPGRDDRYVPPAKVPETSDAARRRRSRA